MRGNAIYKRPSGWRHDSYRHYLAAKGVRTAPMRYNSAKESFAQFLEESFADPGESEQKRYRLSVIDMKRNEVMAKLGEYERDGKISGNDAEKFMREDFTELSKRYEEGSLSKERYSGEVDRLLKRHVRMYSVGLDLWKW